VTTFVGNVEMVRADQRTLSDKASLDKVSNTIDAQGNVYYRADDISFYSDTSFMKLATDESRLRKALFIAPGSRTRGTADVVYRESEFLTRYKNVAYTTCKPGNQDWVVHAQRVKLNKQTGKGAAKHAWLEFKGVPVFYTPYFAFPIDDRRVSGFLNAAWDNTEKNGLDFTVPYYWNIAPNYDAVLRPRYMTERGLMLAGDFRYLTASSKGEFSGELLISDNKATALDEVTSNPHKDKQRGNFKWRNNSRWKPDLIEGDSLAFDVDLIYLSDDDYYDELANSFTVTQSTQMRSFSQLQYQTDEWLLSGLVEHYRTLDHSDKPYTRLPKIDFVVNKTLDSESFALDLAAENEFVYFDKNSGDTGTRINLKPSLALPLQIAGLNMTPKVSVQHTQYWLDNTGNTKTEYSRTLPIVSMDTRFVLEKEYEDVLGLNLLHAIEPRAYYLYIPEETQSNPIFDTSLSDLNNEQLFRENRFNGVDRLGDANQVTLGLTTRLANTDSGLDLAKLTVGQIYYFRDRSVVLPGGAVDTSNYSPVIAELSGAMNAQLTYKANLFWDVDSQDINRGRASLAYRGEDREIVNIGYNYRQNNDLKKKIIQSDLSFLWPVYDDWSVFGGWVYSLKDNLSTEMFAGLEKENCCWRFRVLGKRYRNANTDITTDNDNERYDTGLFVQLELKGLTGLGDKLDAFLEQELPGYQSPAQ